MQLIIFPEQEYRQRYDRMQDWMARKGIESALITGEQNYLYLSGHRHHTPWTTFARPFLLVIPRRGDPVVLTHIFLYDDCKATTWVEEVRPYTSLTETPVDAVKEALLDLGFQGGKIAAELGREQRLGMPVSDFEKLRHSLPGAEWVDVSEIMWKLRARKSAVEAECLRRACRATSDAYDLVFPKIRAGLTEGEIARMLRIAMLEAGAEEPGFVIMCSGRENYVRGSARPANRRIGAVQGEMAWIDLSAQYGGYYSDFSRAGVVGGPTDEQKRLQQLVYEVTQAGVRLIEPGRPVAEIARTCLRELENRGYKPSFEAGRIGHGLGLNSTEPPHVAIYDPTILEPGMAITVEPGIVNEQGIFVVEENVLVIDSGHEVMSGSRRELWTI
ncbi:MAG: Xaa-Pro peptidase family protein [Actinobacteria bacterium]|nr:Xaa-Pro peptidase family protein [Actinomycetota bacterium]